MNNFIKSFMKDMKKIGIFSCIAMVVLLVMLIFATLSTPVVYVSNILQSVFGVNASGLMFDQDITGGRLAYVFTSEDKKILPMLETITQDKMIQNKTVITVVMYGLNNYDQHMLSSIVQCFINNKDSDMNAIEQIEALPQLQGKSTYDRNTLFMLLKTSNETYIGGPTNIQGLSKREKSPADEKSNPNYFSNKNWYHAAGLDGQCTWYSIGRVMEMADQINYSLNMEELRVFRHNGADFIEDALEQSTYQFSYDVNKPATGAIICWGGGFYDGSSKYGHVGVVERVNDDGTIDYTDAYTKNGNIYWTSYNNVSTYDIAIKRSSSPMHPYEFKGYIYILDINKIEGQQQQNESIEGE